MDYADWADEVDFVSNDHYTTPGPQQLDELSFSANLTGNLAGGQPWFLMEHSTSAVNWQPVNVAKKPGELARDSLTHVAHGADAVCFFQWRQSARRRGEVPLGDGAARRRRTARCFRAVVDARTDARPLAPVAGSVRQPARAAIVVRLGLLVGQRAGLAPHRRSCATAQEALDWYSAFLALGVRADVVPTGTALAGYDLVIAPVLHVVPADLAKELTGYVAGGGHLVTTYFSGIVDENDHVWLGGYPGALRDLLGIRIEEFAPLLDGETVELDNGGTGTVWTDRIDVVDPTTSRCSPGTGPATRPAGRRSPGARSEPARPGTCPPGSERPG